MPNTDTYQLKDDAFITALFFSNYQRLVRYARIIFQKHGGYIDPSGRAEEIVQEAFILACEKRDELIDAEDPGKWLTATVTYKIREALKEDRKWAKGLLLLPSEDEAEPFPEPNSLSDLIPAEDYDLLRRLYLEGFTYKELCDELNISKSALAMRVNRIKKAFRKKYEKIFQ